MRLIKEEGSSVDIFKHINTFATVFISDNNIRDINNHLGDFFKWIETTKCRDRRIRFVITGIEIPRQMLNLETIHHYVSSYSVPQLPPPTFGYQFFLWNHHYIIAYVM